MHENKEENDKKSVFIIGSVRDATPELKNKMEEHAKSLEAKGYKVHLPHRDTNQNGRGIEICIENMNAISNSDEVHIFYNPNSQGSHFDMGITFAFFKKIRVIDCPEYGEGKSYPRMINEWQDEYELLEANRKLLEAKKRNEELAKALETASRETEKGNLRFGPGCFPLDGEEIELPEQSAEARGWPYENGIKRGQIMSNKVTISVYLDTGVVCEYDVDDEIKAREHASAIIKDGYRSTSENSDDLEWYPPHRIVKIKIQGAGGEKLQRQKKGYIIFEKGINQ